MLFGIIQVREIIQLSAQQWSQHVQSSIMQKRKQVQIVTKSWVALCTALYPVTSAPSPSHNAIYGDLIQSVKSCMSWVDF